MQDRTRVTAVQASGGPPNGPAADPRVSVGSGPSRCRSGARQQGIWRGSVAVMRRSRARSPWVAAAGGCGRRWAVGMPRSGGRDGYPRRVAYAVSTEVYEGPFDLLLHLILREQVDLYNVFGGEHDGGLGPGAHRRNGLLGVGYLLGGRHQLGAVDLLQAASAAGSPKTRSRIPSAAAARAPATIASAPRSAPRPSRATVVDHRTYLLLRPPPASRRGAVSAISCSITSRPAYVPHTGQTRCGRRGLWQRGHSLSRGALTLWVARRLSRRVREVLFFGTAIAAGW